MAERAEDAAPGRARHGAASTHRRDGTAVDAAAHTGRPAAPRRDGLERRTALPGPARHDAERAGPGAGRLRPPEALAGSRRGRQVVLVTSDLRRARETAAAVEAACGRSGCRRTLACARSRPGSWQGLLQPEIEALDEEAFAAWRAGDDVRLGGAETPTEAGRRVLAAVQEHAARPCRTVAAWWRRARRKHPIGGGLVLGQPELRRVLVPLGNTGTAVLAPPGRPRACAPPPAEPGQGDGPWPGPACWHVPGLAAAGWNVPPSALAELLGRRAAASSGVT